MKLTSCLNTARDLRTLIDVLEGYVSQGIHTSAVTSTLHPETGRCVESVLDQWRDIYKISDLSSYTIVGIVTSVMYCNASIHHSI